ncbi:MAG: carbohydrate ABC transporter permease [Alphaproteobacteria bacterium]|nr:carbohydrate ABC transporter permease [Alphaproteobacteria bacterium]
MIGRPSPWFDLVRHVTLLAGAAVMLAPFVWMTVTSFKPPHEIFAAELTLLPRQWHAYENYREAFTKVPMLRYLLNGAIVTSAIFALQVLVAVPCAYALAKLDFRGRGLIFAMVLLGILIPSHVPAIPLYIMLWQVKLLNTYAALVIPFVISVFGIFLMRQFFKTVPDELIQAARLDGLSEFAIVWRIMVPAAMPAVISFGIFSVVAHWNDYFWPLLVINSRELAPPPLGVAYFRNEEAGHDYGPLMAGAVIIIAPLVLAFLAAQRRFIEGMTMTGLKG